ncbi:MAG: hypothetical protein AAGI91_04955 [Bacteroidota bacterium]
MPEPTSPHPRRLRSEGHNQAYRARILGALALSLLVLTLAFRLWPAERPAPERRYVATPQERIELELIEPTAQTRRAAPPPPPTLPPVEVPDDVEIPEEVIELDVPDLSPDVAPVEIDAPPGLEELDGEPEGPVFVERADRRPRTVTPVFPDYPREAERRDIRARVRIRALIDERGRVQETVILERVLLDKRDREERVAEIGYGVEEAVLDAARRTRFRPGRHGGRPVQTYTTLTLSVGV